MTPDLVSLRIECGHWIKAATLKWFSKELQSLVEMSQELVGM